MVQGAMWRELALANGEQLPLLSLSPEFHSTICVLLSPYGGYDAWMDWFYDTRWSGSYISSLPPRRMQNQLRENLFPLLGYASFFFFFWAPERIEKWHRQIFRDRSDATRQFDSIQNMICMSPTAHDLWKRGAFALKPVDMNPDETEMEAEFYWQAASALTIDGTSCHHHTISITRPWWGLPSRLTQAQLACYLHRRHSHEGGDGSSYHHEDRECREAPSS